MSYLSPRPHDTDLFADMPYGPAALQAFNIVAIIPAYNEAGQIGDVLSSLPAFLRHVIVVDDCSTDRTAEIVAAAAEEDTRIVPVRHDHNQGVGGAMVTGFRQALALDAQIVVKIDGDGQMDPDFLADLLKPLVYGQADYAKGNRFRDFRALRQMPPLRRAGNMALSFMTKAAVGYWNLFDPCNGYVAIRGEALAQLPLESIGRSFFFETSMLAQLYLLGAVVRDVPMPARYGDEISHLSVPRVLGEFPRRLLGCLIKRLVLKNFLYDFSLESLYLLFGVPILTVGLLYGGINWAWYAYIYVLAPTGKVVISAMLIILGFQLVLSAIGEDVRAVPSEPLSKHPLQPQPVRSRVERTPQGTTADNSV